jgi:asparagine synthase (glutamine-hydrolysing)
MSASLETRVPLLDNEVFELAWSVPMEHKVYNKESKYPLRNIISKYIPDEIMNHLRLVLIYQSIVG